MKNIDSSVVGNIFEAARDYVSGHNNDNLQNPLLNPSTNEKMEKISSVYNNTTSKANIKLSYIAERLVLTRQKIKHSFLFLSIFVIIGGIGVISNGLLSILKEIFALNIVDIIVRIYQVIFGLITILLEVTRYISCYRTRSFIHLWLPILDYTFGRGFIQLLAAGLAIEHSIFTTGGLSSLVLGIIGGFNVIYGLSYLIYFNSVSKSIQTQLQQNNVVDLELIQHKFHALDKNGDRKLSCQELKQGCQEMNLSLSDTEIESFFCLFDPNKTGYIDLDKFEAWWYSRLLNNNSIL